MKPGRTVLDVGRGALIGVVEIIPGVSGGTIALIVGIYEDLIDSAGHTVRGLLGLLVGPLRGRGVSDGVAELRAVRWNLLVPVGIGMVVAVLAGARVVAPLIEEHPNESRAFFAGLILVSIAVPARMVGGRWRVPELVLALVVAVAAFLVTSLPAATTPEPSLWFVGVAAAVAICALVLPGLSGSFILLVLGVYAPTLDALNERDLTYIAVFALGAVVGLGAFVQVLRWLLHRHRRTTLVVMTGVMVGSLRALWPWQDDGGDLMGPADDAVRVGLVFLVGGALVLTLLLVDAVSRRRIEELADPPA
ncbi:DUF368 domain-containing protein [Aeromicrobium sp. CF4.19]|uniref:DUF368 domain-containing protein n=1 Tax=Aeromicrobium sp. CF4.19 TaxID=3373082 RepID=UPI003EE4FFF5